MRGRLFIDMPECDDLARTAGTTATMNAVVSRKSFAGKERDIMLKPPVAQKVNDPLTEICRKRSGLSRGIGQLLSNFIRLRAFGPLYDESETKID